MKQGRPRELAYAKQKGVYLDDDTIRLARRYGDGNLSRGLRYCVDRVFKQDVAEVSAQMKAAEAAEANPFG